jgi:hypothetical protein
MLHRAAHLAVVVGFFGLALAHAAPITIAKSPYHALTAGHWWRVVGLNPRGSVPHDVPPAYVPVLRQGTKTHHLSILKNLFSQIGDAAIFSYVFRRTHHDDRGPDTHQHIRRTLNLEARPVDRKILETYLGGWTDAPASSTIRVTLEGGKLMAQGSEDMEKYELQALSDSTFVSQGDPQLITFEKGPEGKVTRMLLRDVGGSVEVYERSLTDRK